MTTTPQTLTLLPGRYAICRLDPTVPVPAWALQGQHISVTRTADELSVICPQEAVPPNTTHSAAWRLLKIEGPFDLNAVGILASIAVPLAEAGVSILAVGTYDTDYLLIQEGQLDRALSALTARGHVCNLQESAERPTLP